jgi:two-component system CheB/CheR fusion protein
MAGQSQKSSYPLVAIGASAGGIPALKKFFEAMPDDPGIAFVVVLHLSPSHESHLVNVLQRTTSLDVIQVGTPPG